MKIVQVLNAVKEFFKQNVTAPYKIPAVEQKEDGWEVIVEVIEEREYMVSHAKDELLGVYKVCLNRDLEVVSFTRMELRERGALVKGY